MEVLIQWIHDHCEDQKYKEIWNKVDMAMIDDIRSSYGDRVLVSLRKLDEKNIRLPIPPSCILSYDKILDSEVGKSLTGLDSYSLIALFLIMELRKGNASFWKPYLDILPRNIQYHPISFFQRIETNNELKGELKKHSLLYKALESQDKKIKNEFTMFQQMMTKEARNKIPLLEKNPPTYEEFLWGNCMVISRAFEMNDPKTIVMLPFVDSMNHTSVNPTVKLRPKLPRGFFLVTIPEKLEPNTELTFNYHGFANVSTSLDEIKEFVMYGFSERGTFQELSRIAVGH